MKTNLLPVFSGAGISGAALAMMAAGMAVSSPASAGHTAKAAAGGDVALVHCSGVNQCKGHNDCKTASNACKGQGSCKGQGFVAASTESCGNISGKVVDVGQGASVAANSMIHCYGINACKGHGSCKGQGFVALPSASCSNAGGSTTAS